MFNALHAFFDIKSIRSKKMGIAWVLAVAGLFAAVFFTRSADISFNGIAEATETVVSVQSAVEIVKVHVEVGQEIRPGDTLVELSRPDLVQRKNEIQRELEALEGRGSLNSATVDQKVAEIQADLNTRRNTILFEIQKLESEHKQNLAIASRLKSISGKAGTGENDAMVSRINGLKQELSVLESNASTQIKLLRGSKGKQAATTANEASAIRQELELIEKEMQEQTILSKGFWVVASIQARDGEKISSFSPILTMTRKEPTQIRGYLHENMYDKVSVGDEVEVFSFGRKTRVRGKVLGMSSQILPFPERLLKAPDMPIYGREVNVSIPENSKFLLGEKVSISRLPGWKTILAERKAK